MKLNNKGFTLIELLAVMIILVSISLVVVGNITESLIRRENKECIEQQELAIGAAKIYFSLEGGSSVTVETLKDKDYYENTNRFDKLNDSDTIKLVNNGNNEYSYKYNDMEVGESCS